MRKKIDKYYKFREYEVGDMSDYLLFLVSEVGELTDAYSHSYGTSPDEFMLFDDVFTVGLHADEIVSKRKHWTRNGDRHKPPSIADEVADVYMMLDRFAFACGLPTPEECLKEKMKRKGFTDV